MKKNFILFLIFFSFFVFADELNDSFAAAVQAGNVKTASEVFAKGADINFVDEDWPLFVTAVTSGDVAMTEFFIKNGVNLEFKGPDGKTALLHAISLKNKKLVELRLILQNRKTNHHSSESFRKLKRSGSNFCRCEREV